ncbi:MAG: 1,4-dihydroxy-2-naphthoate octaprenyltransferase [Bacteroidaceae bacterium]|nr:1,4-dihydroxy-2-naphthoate octaprenyltransferase [Bacteroidaceae bacterium]
MTPAVSTNSPLAWVLAARPKTLAAALAPVLVATALALADGVARPMQALLCALFALVMQVAANLINDYFDFARGTDDADRLGPERAMAQGWITPRAMRGGIALSVALAALIGMGIAALFLASSGGDVPDAWPLVVLGAACIAGAFLYTLLMSYIALGDLLVWLFFGFVPVCGTYYVQAATLTLPVWLAAAACGLVTDTLLVLNNYRDRDTDSAHHKHTLVSVLGEPFGRYFYFAQGVLGCASAYALSHMGYPVARLVVFYLYFHLTTWQLMARLRSGRALNRVLGLTARNILLFALLLSLGLLLRN